MRNLSSSFFLLMASAVLIVCTSVWAYDMYLEVDGIPGECNDAGYINWIDAFAFSHTIQNMSGTSNGTHGAFSVTKMVDKATPPLYLRACDGHNIPTVTLDVVNALGDSFLTITLNNATLVEISTEGSSTNTMDAPYETVAFYYEQIEWSYQEYGAGGSPVGAPIVECWSVKTQAPCTP